MKREIYICMSGAKKGFFALVLTLLLSVAYSQSYTVAYTGSVQTLTLTATGKYRIECWGANGGSVIAVGGAGIGGYSAGDLNISGPTVLNVYAGGAGVPSSGLLTGNATAGGWNGGGGGSKVGVSGGGGGGATDVRMGGIAPGNRIIVAGGGGGAAGYYTQTPNNLIAAGGNGGGLVAANGNTINSSGVITIGGGGQGASGATPGASPIGGASDGTAGGGGGGANSVNGASTGGQGVGGGAGGAGGMSGSGSTGCASGGGGGYAGGAGGVQNNNGAAAGGGGSGYVGGVSNGTTVMSGQTGFVANPDLSGNGYVVITFVCDLSLQVSRNPICVGDQISLSTNAGGNVQWSHGPTTPTVLVSPSVSTTYTVSGVGTNPTGCTNTIVVTVSVNPLPNISASAFPPMVCQQQNGTLTANGAASYTWSPGNSTGNIFVTNPVSSTVYTVQGESAEGCHNTTTLAVNVNTNQLVVSANTTICEGSPAYLSANGAVSYYWTFGAPFQTVAVYPSSSVLYNVTGIDQYNCTLTGSVLVTVNPRPSVNVAAANTVICSGEPLELFASGASSYQWSNGASGTTYTQVPKYDLPLTFAVTGTDNNGCSSTASITVMVNACVSVGEQQAAVFRLMPNPASSQVTIESNSDATLHISDLAGRIVFEGKIQKGSQSVDVSSLSNGVYLVQLQTGDSVRTVRLIKN